jgi:hypothetical protein
MAPNGNGAVYESLQAVSAAAVLVRVTSLAVWHARQAARVGAADQRVRRRQRRHAAHRSRRRRRADHVGCVALPDV